MSEHGNDHFVVRSGVPIEQGQATSMGLDELLCGIIESAVWMFVNERRLSYTKFLFDI